MAPRVVHELPNRLRLRFAASDTRQALAAGAVRDLPGVARVRANPGARALVVHYDGAAATRSRILATAADPPARAFPLVEAGGTEGPALALAGAAVVGSLMLPRRAAAAITVANIAGTVLRGVHAAATEGLKVEVLDALAVGLPTVRGRFVTANVARFLMELAAYIESTTVERSDALLRSLLHREPDDVWVEEPGGQLVRTRFHDLKGGEHVAVGLGETVPVDGVVVAGDAYVDQAAVTGESLPLPRAAGDDALAGSIVTDGRIVVRADRIGDATTTGRITRYIQEALERPAEIQSLSDALADRRVGITLGSAAGVFALTGDWRRIESVFMVDYSCTVKLGTPIVLKTAMYNAARQGCLVKSGQAIENLARVDTVVFDKTGTLTHNTLQVTDVVPLAPDLTEEQAVAIVASLGEHTTHPIARAVVELARARQLAHVDHQQVNFIVGHGVEGVIGDDIVRFGSRHYLEDDEHVSFARQRQLVAALQAEGKSLLYVARNDRPLAVFALRDRLRDEAHDVVRNLREIGIRHCVMITGDHRAKALAFGEALGLDEIHYEQQPEDKAGIVARLKAEGRRIAYVGDGVNDGPALIAADVGIAMPRAADIARATADIVLLDDHLASLVTVLDMSRRAMDLIESNFRVAVGANSVILAGAVTGILPSIATAALHNGTTIAVLARSLMARRRVPSPSNRLDK